MQKSKTNASILIWTIFISLVISITFISISTKINKNLRDNQDINNNISENNEIQDYLKSETSSKTFEDKKFDNYFIDFEQNNYYEIWLKKDEEITLFFLENSNIDIQTTSTIEYTNNWLSWVISNTKNWISIIAGDLKIKNLSWYTYFQIKSDKDFETLEKKYNIYKIIWNKIVLKESGIIK